MLQADRHGISIIVLKAYVNFLCFSGMKTVGLAMVDLVDFLSWNRDSLMLLY